MKLEYPLKILFLGTLFEIVSFSLTLNCKRMKGNKYSYQSSSLSDIARVFPTSSWSPPSPEVSLQLTVSVLNYQPPPSSLPSTPSTISTNSAILQYITKYPKLLGSTLCKTL